MKLLTQVIVYQIVFCRVLKMLHRCLKAALWVREKWLNESMHLLRLQPE